MGARLDKWAPPPQGQESRRFKLGAAHGRGPPNRSVGLEPRDADVPAGLIRPRAPRRHRHMCSCRPGWCSSPRTDRCQAWCTHPGRRRCHRRSARIPPRTHRCSRPVRWYTGRRCRRPASARRIRRCRRSRGRRRCSRRCRHRSPPPNKLRWRRNSPRNRVAVAAPPASRRPRRPGSPTTSIETASLFLRAQSRRAKQSPCPHRAPESPGCVATAATLGASRCSRLDVALRTIGPTPPMPLEVDLIVAAGTISFGTAPRFEDRRVTDRSATHCGRPGR